MSHLDERELILLYYGELPGSDAARHHLAACASCRRASEALQRDLAPIDALPLPDRGDEYGRQVWRRIEPRLARRGVDWRALWSLPRLGLAAAVAVLLVVAFLAGHWHGRSEPISPEARERVLLFAVGEHLERSERLLVEIVNAEAIDGAGDALLQARAGRLVADNRLYRRTIGNSDPQVADLLDELERLLIEIANASAEPDTALLAELQRRIDRRGILLRIRVLGERTTQQQSVARDRAAGRV